jgi:O-antigen ligase
LIAGTSDFRRTRAGLIAAAFLAPFSATHIAGPLTVGRVAALCFGALLAADLLMERPWQFRLDFPSLLLIAGYVGMTGWIYLNMAAWGCNCYGKAGGFFEFAAIGLLSLVAIGFEPRLRTPALLAALSGLVLAALLALAGVGAINSSTVDISGTGGRLSGTFGNANELGFAVAIGLVIALAYLRVAPRGMTRIALFATAILLLVALGLTYSRGAVIAAGAGALTLALEWAWGSRRRVRLVLAGAVIVAALGAVLYSVFEKNREEASFESVPSSLAGLSQRDESGWDRRSLGPITDGPSTIRNSDGAIAVRGSHPGEGLSIRWGEAGAGGTYMVLFRARTDGTPLPFRFALADATRSGSGAKASGILGRQWRPYSLSWRPRLRSPHAALYIWLPGQPGTFEFSDARILTMPRAGSGQLIELPDRLEGSIYGRLISTATRAEKRYLQSRVDAAREAIDAFRSQPLRGIGWTTFPVYTATHLNYGQLAAHDQYLAFAAELGIIGLLLLAVLIAAVTIGARHRGSGPAYAAALAIAITAAVGMLSLEPLPVPQNSIPIALAAAVLCSPRRPEPG